MLPPRPWLEPHVPLSLSLDLDLGLGLGLELRIWFAWRPMPKLCFAMGGRAW